LDHDSCGRVDLVWFPAHEQDHRLTCFHDRFDDLLVWVDADSQAAPAPLNPEGQVAPTFR
jgi:hypothetical protein